jgi:hypothetical protein
MSIENYPPSDLEEMMKVWEMRLALQPDGVFLEKHYCLEIAAVLHHAKEKVKMLEWLDNQTRVDIGETENGGYEHRANDTNYYTLEKVVGRAMRGEPDSTWETS